MKVNKIAVNLFLVLVAAGLLWYIVQSQNLLGEKQKQEVTKQVKVEIPFSEKSFSLDYKKFDPLLVENIALFTKEEKWIGSGFYNKDNYFEYQESLNLTGSERNKIVAVKDVFLNLSKIIDFDLMLNLQSDANDLETADLIFIDNFNQKAKFTLSRQQNTGWSIMKFPKQQFDVSDSFNWAAVKQVRFEFIPRPLGKLVINLGSLRGQPGTILYNDWNLTDQKALVLDKRNNEINLLVRSLGGSVATIKKITSASNFSFQSSYTPLNNVSNGLFFRGNYQDGQGYYLLVSGINGNQWQLHKLGKDGVRVLATGEIANFQFKSGKKYYLKAETKNSNIKAYFSSDNVNYTLLADVMDGEFNSGGVGVATGNGGIGLFNDFEFKQ